jgi:hypothetical protein
MAKLLFVRQRFLCLGSVFIGRKLRMTKREPTKRGERSPRDASERALRARKSPQFSRIRKHSNPMIRSIVFGFLLLSSSAWADTFRIHYSIRGSGRDVTVQAESSGEARRTVMDMFPGALVTGVHRIRK